MPPVGRNILSLALSRITSGVILFVVQARLAAHLGPDEFGKYGLVIAFYTMFLLFVDFGISRYFIKKINENEHATQTYFNNFLIAQLVSSVVIFFVFILLPSIFSYEADVRLAMWVAAAGLFFISMSLPFVALLQAKHRSHLIAVFYFFDSLVKALWLAAAIIFDLDLTFLVSVLVVTGASDLVIFWLLTRGAVRTQIRLQKNMLQEMLRYGVTFALLVGFETLIAKADVIIQKQYLDFSQVGLYSAAYRFLDFLTFLPAVVAISLFPHFSGQSVIDSPENKIMAERIHRLLLAIALPLGVGCTVLGQNIVVGFFGPEYQDAVAPFQILIWSTIITLFYAVANVVMQVKALRQALLVLFLATAVNLVGNILLVPRYGILASAWLTVLSYLIVAAWYLAGSRRYLKYPLWRSGLWPLAASAVMGLVLWQLQDWNVFALIGLAAALYFGILFAVRFLKTDDLKFKEFLKG